MEQQKLPNTTISLILAIVAFLGCCCLGIGGIIPSAIALVLANKDKKKYEENPELYSNYKQANTARTIAIIALVLSSAFFVYCLVRYLFFGGPEAVDVFWEEYQKQLEIQSQS